MPLLVSFCNQHITPQNSLLLLDDVTHHAQWIEIPLLSEGDSGCTGIETANGKIYVLTQSPTPQLIVFDQSLRITSVTELKKVRDAHSLCHWNGSLFAVSTGDNSVYRLPLSDDGEPTKEEEHFWRFPGIPETVEDLVHLNSISVLDDRLIVTCFGKKVEPETWKSTTNGFCIRIADNKILAENLYHPHTVQSSSDGLYICASSSRQLLRYEVTADEMIPLKSRVLDGYTRGLAETGTTLFLGQSEGRKKSRSRGTEYLAENETAGSKIYLLDKEFASLHEIDVSSYGAEIYDICYLPSVPFLIADTAKSERISALEKAHTDNKKRLTQWALDLQTKNQQQAARIVTLQGEVEDRSSWALKLKDDVEARDSLISTQQVELQERTAWALKLKDDLEGRDAGIAALQKQLEERTDWALKLRDDVEEQTSKVSALQKQLEERTDWALKLRDDVEEQTSKVSALQKQLEERTDWALKLRDDLEEQTSKLSALQKQLEERTDWALKLRDDLEEQTSRVTALQEQLEDRTAWALRLKDDLQVRDAALAELRKEFDARTAWALTLKQNVEQRDAEIQLLQKAMEELKTSTLTLQQEVANGDARISALEASAAQFERDAAHNKAVIETQKAELYRAQEDKTLLEAEVRELSTRLSHEERMREELTREHGAATGRLETEVARRDKTIEELRQSLSWRITAPLRAVYGVLRGKK